MRTSYWIILILSTALATQVYVAKKLHDLVEKQYLELSKKCK